MADERPIVGRETELAELSGLAASPAGRALLVRGEAGVGKSVLLDAAAARSLALGHLVVRAAGAEAESELPFAGLHQIIPPLVPPAAGGERGTPGGVETVCGGTTGEAPSVMTLGVAVLDLLALVSGDRPLLVVVDDAHWFDPQSAEVGRFIARRLSAHAVRMAIGVRADVASAWDAAGLSELTVPALDARSAGLLLDAYAPDLAEGPRHQVLDQARGNPLALLELPRALREGTAHDPGPGELPLSRRLEQLYGDRIRTLAAAERTELLRGALDGTGAAPSPADRARYRLSGVDGALAAGLLTVDATTGDPVFRHPLVRSALVQSATPNQRRAAHAELARLHHADIERHAVHLAAATVDPDEAVAAVLERAARSATARGAAASAVALLPRAAELSPGSVPRSRRLGDAAFVAAQSALLDRAQELREVSDRLTGTHRSPTAVITSAYAALYRDGDVRPAHRRVAAALGSLPEVSAPPTRTRRRKQRRAHSMVA
ncbi:AAA family ATPase, partial [Streptomyces sp. NPDC059466]|uniref:AAA family ATPase n=1 Tax=Streptomyces sp. NPDC059466 TaxID=3346843 RepID=UPI0036CC85D8